MAKSSNQSAPRNPASPPLSPASQTDTANAEVPATKGIQRIPFVWRVVFAIWAICFGLMILSEVSSYIGKLLR
jgi:hypothetical protein